MTSVIETIDSKNPSKEDLQKLLEELKRLKEVDIRTVDINELVDISSVEIKMDLPVLERVIDYIKQVKNPYCYRVHNTAVKVSFTGDKSLNDCLKTALYGGGSSNPELPRYGKGGW
ncbi:MAG: hypothetical protein K6G11_02135 [Lachnospiraceae bacterium]|nr:hypothetical protein [Lachnospiraceae bacterium]